MVSFYLWQKYTDFSIYGNDMKSPFSIGLFKFLKVIQQRQWANLITFGQCWSRSSWGPFSPWCSRFFFPLSPQTLLLLLLPTPSVMGEVNGSNLLPIWDNEIYILKQRTIVLDCDQRKLEGGHIFPHPTQKGHQFSGSPRETVQMLAHVHIIFSFHHS